MPYTEPFSEFTGFCTLHYKIALEYYAVLQSAMALADIWHRNTAIMMKILIKLT